MFDWQESRFGEMAEPDPLSFGSLQQAQHAQQADRAGQNMAAVSNTFQVWHIAPFEFSSASLTVSNGLLRAVLLEVCLSLCPREAQVNHELLFNHA